MIAVRRTRSGRRGHRVLLAAALALLAPTLLVVSTALPASADATIVSPGPLTSIGISSVLNCSVTHEGDSSGEWYGITACGTFVAAAGSIFGPTSVPAGSGVTGVSNYEPYTPVSQVGPSGTGSAADPFVITTVVDLGSTGLRLTQRDLYVTGQETTRTDVTITNSGNSAQSVILYRAGDCYLQDDDDGLGAVSATTVTCKALPSSAQPSRIEQFIALTPGHRYLEDEYDNVWAAVGTGAPLPNTCRCDEQIDNGIAMSWSLAVPAGGSVVVSAITAFSPLGAEPVTVTKTTSTPSVAPGGTATYQITVTNPGAIPATLSSITDTLPTGFAYVAGTSSGATTTDPAIAGQQLTWGGPFVVPAASQGPGQLTLTFSATASTTAGTYTNSASATGDGLTVIPAIDVAPVTVEGTAPTTAPPPPPSSSTTSTSTTTTTTTPEETTTTSEAEVTTTSAAEVPTTAGPSGVSGQGVQPSGGALARTGSDTATLALIGLTLSLLGGATMVLRRRRLA